MLDKLKALQGVFFKVDSRTIYLYSFLTGCVTGLVAVLFYSCVEWLSHFLFDDLANLPLDQTQSMLSIFSIGGEGRPIYLLVLLLPALGGLLVGLCAHYLDPNVSGTGIDRLLESFHNQSGNVRKRTAFVKFLASTITISTGGSVGKEGPMALIGAGIGSLYGRFIKMGARARRTLLLAGSAGGLGAIFRAPLGGAITAVEVLYKEDFEADALLPCIISSVTAYTVFSSFLGFGHHITFEASIFSSPLELIFYALLGLFCSGAGYLFIRIFRFARERVFEAMPLKRILRPALGGLFIGIIALFFPQAIGEGLGVIQGVINGHYPDNWVLAAGFLLLIAAIKMVATSITIQSGGSGGVLIPALFIGAMLGGAFGTVCHHFFPELVPSVTPYVVVGMAAFFACVTNASLGALVMVTELTGGYELLPPLMIVSVISLVTSHRWSIYREQVKNKFASQAHLWDMNPMNLQHAKIADAFHSHYQRQAVIRNDLKMDEIEALAHRLQESDFIVEDDKQALVGLFSLKDVAADQEEISEAKHAIVAQDLTSRKLFYVSESDSLYEAMKYLLDSDFDKVPVVRQEGEGLRLLGYLRHEDILQYYYRMGLQHEKPKPESQDPADTSGDTTPH